MGANGGTLPPDRKGKALSVGAHPADLAPRNPYHQGEGGHISIDDSARADECVFTNGHPADNRAVGPQGGPLFHQGVPVLFLAADRGARIVDIGENHAGPAKDIVFQRHIVIYGDIVLNLHIVADHHAVADKHILAQGALFPITAPPQTCTQCQIRVPAPMRAPESTMAEGWILTPDTICRLLQN